MENTTDNTTVGSTVLDPTIPPSIRAEIDHLFRTRDTIWTVSVPIILALGLFGNFMIILIMRRFSESSLTIFFQVLALSDLLLLSISLLPVWMHKQFDVAHIERLGAAPCKLSKLLTYTSGVLSAWTLVALTLQRAASVLWPHRVNAVWTKRKSRIVVGVLMTVITLIHSQFIFVFGLDTTLCARVSRSGCCFVKHIWFYYSVWPWLDLAEFSLLPFALLLISNSVLLWKLISSVRTGSNLPVQQSTQETRQKKVSSLTVTLMTVSGSFFLLTTPVPLYLITKEYVVFAKGYLDPLIDARYAVFWTTANLMWYTNSAINFYLYCLTGTKFRAEFYNIMKTIFNLCYKGKKSKEEQASFPSLAVKSHMVSAEVDIVSAHHERRAVSDNEF
ncbi:hypothetical protein ACOMHN_042079 [Nucella lapillus]